MSGESPIAELYNSDGYPLSVYSGVATPTNTPAIMVAGSDGANSRYILVDGSSRLVTVGAGTAGTPAGGVLTIQGAVGGTAVPVSGTVAVTQSTSPWVSNITQFGGNNVVTGTGTSGVGIPRVTVSNDSNILATQSGAWTVTSNQGTANTLSNKWPVQITDGTNTMPTGDAIGRAIYFKLTDGTNTATVTAGNALKIDGSAVVQPVSGTVTANQGTANTLSNAWPVKVTDGTNTMPTGDAVGRAIFHKITDGTNTAAVKAASTAAVASDPSLVVAFSPNSPLPTGSNTIGAVTQASGPWTTNVTQFGSNNVVTGTGASGSGIPRVTVSNDSNILATQSGGWTVTANQGTPNTLGNKWPVQVTDGTNTMPTGDAVARAIFHKITDGTNTATVKAASTAAATTDPALVVALSPNSNGVNIYDNHFYVQSNATVTVSGSQIISGNFYGVQQINLIVNIKNAPTGSSPTINYTIQEVDPGDNTTTFGNSATTGTLTGVGVYTANLTATSSSSIKVSWTVTGSSPSFTGVYATVIAKATSTTIQTTTSSAAAATGVAFGRVQYGTTSGVLTPMRATTYTEQTTNFTGSVKSSSANDNNVGGTGARTVMITYYTQTGSGPFTETVALNGTTAVNLVNSNHCYIEKMVVVTVGSTGCNQGTISLFTGSGGTGTTVGTIGFGNAVSSLGDNTTLWAHHYTPIGKTTSIFLINAGTPNNQSADVHLRSIPVLTANAAEVKISDSIISASSSDSVSRSSANPILVSGFARTTMYVVSNGSNTTFSGGFDYSDQ